MRVSDFLADLEDDQPTFERIPRKVTHEEDRSDRVVPAGNRNVGKQDVRRPFVDRVAKRDFAR